MIRRRLVLVLPSAAQRLVKSDDLEQLIAFGAGQAKLAGEKLLLRFENFVVAGFAGKVSL